MLNDKILRKLITEQGLVTGYIDLDKQLQPSGFDLSLEGVETYLGGGAVDFSNEERVIAETEKIEPDGNGWISLGKGVYKVVYNEVVKMPLNIGGYRADPVNPSEKWSRGGNCGMGSWLRGQE